MFKSPFITSLRIFIFQLCALLVITQADDPTKAVAAFNDGNKGLRGFVYFEKTIAGTLVQADMYAGVGIQNPLPLSWHIHVSPVPDDIGTNCSAAGGHLNLKNLNETDHSDCGKDVSKWANNCVTGLMSKKFASFRNESLIGGTDPSFTIGNIIGRSIVFHTNDTNNPRIACANIRPDTRGAPSPVASVVAPSPVSTKVSRCANRKLLLATTTSVPPSLAAACIA